MKFFLFLTFFGISAAQKCSTVQDKQNATQSVLCQNVNSMNDVADEIKNIPQWLSIKIVNKAPIVEFTNKAVNVPYLHLVQSLDLSRAGTLNFNDDGFSSYDSLRNLDISNTGLKMIKFSWFSKKNVEVLDVSRNKITELKREHLKYLPKLKTFNASFNDMIYLEVNAFMDCKKIETIDVSNNHVNNVHFEGLDNLRYLNLRSNSLSGVGANYLRMPKLEVLNFAENQIHGVGDRWIEPFESLKYVNLSNNKIPHIGEWTFGGGEKTKLTVLDMSYNAITMIYPIALNHLPALTFFDVSNNKITDIYAKNFVKQTLLQSLYLNDNRIEKIVPASFENLLQLRVLDISGNKLKAFNADLFGSKFSANRLRKLNLSHNQMTALDAALLAMLRNLVSLNVAFNNLKDLSPDTLKNNRNLVELVLDNNELEFLQPTFFKNLNALEEFSIQNNRVTFIPDITGLKKLERLSVGNNPLQCICMKELLIWTRSNKCKFIHNKPNPKNPDCVVIPETECVMDKSKIDSYGMYDRFLDGMPFEEVDPSSFMI